MDSYMPWTVVRNIVRGFSPTLFLLIIWDLWRNLMHAASTRQLGIVADIVALGVVAAIRLAPPLAPAREQVKRVFSLSWAAFFGALFFLVPLMFHKRSGADLQEGLLLASGYAFYIEMSHLCRTTPREIQRLIGALCLTFASVCLAFAIVSTLVYGTASLLWDMIHGSSMELSAVILILIIPGVFSLLSRWFAKRMPDPVVQALEVNQQETPVITENR